MVESPLDSFFSSPEALRVVGALPGIFRLIARNSDVLERKTEDSAEGACSIALTMKRSVGRPGICGNIKSNSVLWS